jgi:adenosylcobinamide-GDP ribazoletransferase
LVVKQLKNLLAFLTVFPVQMDMDMLSDCAKNMWTFPLVGAFLGLLAGLFSWAAYYVLPAIVVGAVALALLLWMTGLHHTDGLLDFGDGVMAHGTPQRKIEVMHDQLTGAGAIGLCVMTYLITAFAFAALGSAVFYGGFAVPLFLPALIVAELCSKLSMVVAAWAGKSVHEGMNSPFLEAMHGRGGNWRLLAAIAISLVIALPLLRWAGIFAVLAAAITGLVMVAVAHRNFGGVTGDVFGATNELTRMVCVIVVLAVTPWM